MQEPIPEKLQRAIGKAYRSGWGTYLDVADLFDISRRTVDRFLKKDRLKAPLGSKRPTGGRKPPIKLSDEPHLLEIVEANADTTIDELCSIWRDYNGQSLSRSSWHRELHRLSYSKKFKVMNSRRVRCPETARKRVSFLRLMPKLTVEKLKFLDESGVQMHLQPERAWCKRGESPVYYGHVRPGKNYTVIGAISCWGLEAMTFQDRPMKRVDFERFVDVHLAPKISRGDVVVMSNLQIHRSSEVADSLALLGAKTLFLPPYSPDLNPIEKVWRCLKSKARKNNNLAAEKLPCHQTFSRILQSSWESLRTHNLEPLIRDSGYRAS